MDISQEQLLERLCYNPKTGELKWSLSPKVWAAARGKTITHVSPDGYIIFTLTHNGKRRSYRAHRVIWKMMTGSTPDVIDHKNRKRSDNRWLNLRNGTQKANMQNLSGKLFCEKWNKFNKALADLRVSF